ncbi:MAG: N-acetylglucosamine-6-phosphate deacetylase [Pseudomonadota bacterium]
MSAIRVLKGGLVFDGTDILDDHAVVIGPDHVVGVIPARDAPHGEVVFLNGDILCPPFVDLQVNGGGGVLFNDAPTEAGLATIAAAHRAAGTQTILPTLITDTPEVTRAAIEAVATTAVAGIAGLHLEGPHLSPDKAGAHDRGLIRPMGPDDLDMYLDAARRVPRLLITLAPEAVAPQDIATLARAGVTVSLGHSAADYSAAMAAFDAGASMATHLFNAMGPVHHRDPGLPGAALSRADVTVGVIADGLHVHPAMLGAARRAKIGADTLFLVTDAMAPFGTGATTFSLMGRSVRVHGPRLTLEDGTLAGANADMLGAIRVLVEDAATPLRHALTMATRAPALAADLPAPAGQIAGGGPLPLRLARDLSALKALA